MGEPGSLEARRRARYSPPPMAPRTLFEKIWESHVVAAEPGAPSILYIDLHLIHEMTSPQAFAGLRKRGLKVRRPERTVATIDHIIPTTEPTRKVDDPAVKDLLSAIENDRQPECSVLEGRTTVEMIAAVFESHRVGGPVTFPLKTRVNPLSLL